MTIEHFKVPKTAVGNDPADYIGAPEFLAKLPINQDRVLPDNTIVPTPFEWRAPETIPPREWLHAKHYIRKFLVLTGGTYGIAKSTLTIIDALSMVTGRCLLTKEPLRRPLRAWLYNTEDPREEVERKVAAVMKFYGLTGDDIGDRLFIDTSRENKLIVGGVALNVSFTAPVPSSVEGLVKGIQQRGVDVLIVDPLVHSHNADENSNTAMGHVMAEWRRVAEESNCCVELVHHTRKGNGDATVDDVRGAAAIMGAVRSARLLSVMTTREAGELGIAEEQRRFHIWVNPTGKPSLMPPISVRQWLRLESVSLGNVTEDYPDGDSVGVLSSWEPPNHRSLLWMNPRDCEPCWWAIRQAAPLNRRKDVQSSGWIGHVIAKSLGLDPSTGEGKAQVKAAVSEWIKSGLLIEETTQSAARKAVPVLAINWAATGLSD